MALALCLCIWLRPGLDAVYFDTDAGRDLSEISNILQGRVVWLGPRLDPGLQASPSYYYSLAPFVWAMGGDAHGLVIGNIVYVGVALAVFGVFAVRKWGWQGILATVIIGMFPWWVNTVLHAGNGYTYAYWTFTAVALLWFEVPLFLAAFCFGMATSFHPAAIFAMPLFCYEWLRILRGKEDLLRKTATAVVAFLLPWAPLIVFEGITKGYLVRNWLTHPSSGAKLMYQLQNMQQLALHFQLSLPLFVGIAMLIFIWVREHKRLRMWVMLTTLTTCVFLVVFARHAYYLLGLASIWGVLFAVVFAEPKPRWWVFGSQHRGRITEIRISPQQYSPFILGSIAALSITRGVLSPVPSQPTRTISRIQAVSRTVAQWPTISHAVPTAVVAALSPNTEVPQADDYRFFLRMQGLNVLEVVRYSAAQQLILFIEVPGFDWQHWSNWEIEQIGAKELVTAQEIDGVTVVVFRKH